MTFGKLTVIERVLITRKNATSKNGVKRENVWLCECECGNKKNVYPHALRNGSTKSCGECRDTNGVKRKDYNGEEFKRLRDIFKNMKRRCYDEKNKDFKNYGGKGIKIHEEWLNDPESFCQWSIENGYDDNLTIDRIDSCGNYSPDNCRWVTMKVQQNNRTNNLMIEINGKKQTMQQWVDETGIKYSTLRYRYHKGIRGQALLGR